jgi:formylglycine-generating enzyme required for sulfatase activity
MMRERRAPALLLYAAALAGCGEGFLGSDGSTPDGDRDGSTSAADGSSASEAGGSDGGAIDAAPEPCTKIGATRACNATSAQTCTPVDATDGDASTPAATWGPCAPIDCAGATPGASESCIPAGGFTMGGTNADSGAPDPATLPQHPVTLTHRFYMDQYEVTVGEFDAWWKGGTPKKPAAGYRVYVSGSGDVLRWTDADDAEVKAPGTGVGCTAKLSEPLASINCVNQKTALAYCLAFKKRLPTEAEWEYAASGQGKGNDWPWGTENLTPVEEASCLRAIDGVCSANPPAGQKYPFPRPSAVMGNTKPEHGNLNNLAGNMAEWTLDFAPKLGASCTVGTCFPSGTYDPWAATDEGTGIVVRGGSYRSAAAQVRTHARAFVTLKPPDDPSTVGFRCVRVD